MVWFKVDDKFHSSEEVMSIPLAQRAAAIGLWTLAGAWSSDQLKDGYVPATHLENWGGTPDVAAALVRAKLWTRVGAKGYQFRNWAKWQKMREVVEEERAANNKRVADHRARKAAEKAQSNDGVTHYDDGVTTPRPVQTRPQPDKDQSIGGSRAREVPEDGLIHNGGNAVDNAAPNFDRILVRLRRIVPDAEPLNSMLVSDHFLGRAKGAVHQHTGYVLRCIAREENAVENFLHTGRWSE